MSIARSAWSRAHAHLGLWAVACLGLAFVSLATFHWLPFERALAAAILNATTIAAVAAAWSASRRARASKKLSRAWGWVALALAGQAAGSLTQLAYEYAGAGEAPYPSLADPLYLSFYPLLLVGVLSFPAKQRSGRQLTELLLDCAVVGFAGSALCIYLVLGSEILADSGALEAVVTISYPVGDMILLVGLGAAVLRSDLPETRATLRWVTAAMGLFVIGDLIFGYAILHGGYQGGDLLDTLYLLAFACFIGAATKQRADPDSGTVRISPRLTEAHFSWLPYLAVAVCLAILVAQEAGEPFFPDLGIVLIVAAAMVVVVVRQLMSIAIARQGQERLAEAQGLARLGSWDWDVEHDRILLSDEAARLCGVDPAVALTSKGSLVLVHPGDREMVSQIVNASLVSNEPFALEARVLLPKGAVRVLFVRGEIEVRGGRTVGVHGTHQDITDRKLLEAQLQHQADHDPLTGLYNRRRFSIELERVLRYASRYSRCGAVLMLDVDNFKLVNDAQGHSVGDATLSKIGTTIGAAARETDVVARIGGDEFVIVLPEADESQALEVAEKVRRAVAGIGTIMESHLSVGVALFDGVGECVPDDVMVAADISLYEAKAGGRDQIRIYSGKARLALSGVKQIREALRERRFVLYAQPMIELENGAKTHRELLIRMLSDDGKPILPGAFLPTAERFGLINEIDRWVIGEALLLSRRGERVSINLSAPSIGDAEILARVREAVADGVDPAGLIFEITETAVMTNLKTAQAFVAALSEMGCGVALDDFGTGFGSFTYLKQLQTRYLKIDKEFVRGMLSSASDRQVVRSITDVAHSLGKLIVAEGVEDAATLEALTAYGVDLAQGFLIGHPRRISPLTAFERTLAGTSVGPPGPLSVASRPRAATLVPGRP